MKVGILNFHFAHNYGAMLQAYALQEEVRKNNNVEIINFQPKKIKFGYELYNPKILLKPRRAIGTILNFKNKKKKYDLFEKFSKEYFNLSERMYKDEINLQDEYDAVICGSDQIWNMDLNGGHKEYLLSFLNDRTRRISYAASIGTARLSEKNQMLMKDEISKFDYISVREADAVKVMSDAFDINVEHVLDPVFLKTKNEWDRIAVEQEMNGDYVLVYGLEENELFDETLKFLKENYNYKIINISPSKKKSNYIDKYLYGVGPQEFLGLIKNARLVFTNSFHGTCFSIIYGKDFLVLGHSELNSRIESILKITGLQKHMISEAFTQKDIFEKIVSSSYTNYENILNNEIEKSRSFLEKSLK